jgi:aryl-alcohol dehydrogenase-like predicted oxidoreductase
MGLFSDTADTDAVRRLGLGGFHVGKIADEERAIEMVHHAIDAGFELLDNSWDYHGGESERRIGRALSAGGYRDHVVVMTKVDSRSYDGVMRQFSESLERLQLDRIDLLQLHEVIRPTDAEDAVAKGAMRALKELQDQGTVKHIGLTGHKDPRYLIDAIDRAAAEGVRLETCQMPINAADVRATSFRDIGLRACVERGIEVLGMKPLGAGDFVGQGGATAPELLRWALSQPVAVCITGCESIEQVDQAVAVLQGFTPMEPDEQRDLESRLARLIDEGSLVESYKSTAEHDATNEHTDWLA